MFYVLLTRLKDGTQVYRSDVLAGWTTDPARTLRWYSEDAARSAASVYSSEGDLVEIHLVTSDRFMQHTPTTRVALYESRKDVSAPARLTVNVAAAAKVAEDVR